MKKDFSMKDVEILSSEELSGLRARLSEEKLTSADFARLNKILALFLLIGEILQKKHGTVLRLLRQIFGLKTEKVKNKQNPVKTDKDKEKV